MIIELLVVLLLLLAIGAALVGLGIVFYLVLMRHGNRAYRMRNPRRWEGEEDVELDALGSSEE